MRYLMLALLMLVNISPSFATEATTEVLLENMTSPEVRDAIAAGKTTVIVPTGGTEQSGPHIVLGKHNYTLRYTAPAIAQKLGNALVAPVMTYVPEGDISPPQGNMRFAGTLSLRPDTFAAVLEDTARSLKQHGFRTICFVGENGANQLVQKVVAEKLSALWKEAGVKVLHVNDYYDEHNGQTAYLTVAGVKDSTPQAHGGLADTSEQMKANPVGVRDALRGIYTADDFTTLGVEGSSDKATAALGEKLLQLKIDAAVKHIERERVKQP